MTKEPWYPKIYETKTHERCNLDRIAESQKKIMIKEVSCNKCVDWENNQVNITDCSCLTCIGTIQQCPSTRGFRWGSIKYVKFAMETTRCFGLDGFSKQNWHLSFCVMTCLEIGFSSRMPCLLRFCFLLGATSKPYSSSSLPDMLYCLFFIIILARWRSASSSLLIWLIVPCFLMYLLFVYQRKWRDLFM